MIDGESLLFEEPDQRHVEFAGHLNCQCGRSPHRSDHGDAAHGGFLHEFKTRPSTDQDQMVVQWQMAVHQGPSQDFIQRIMTSDILPNAEEVALFVKEAGGVAAAGLLE